MCGPIAASYIRPALVYSAHPSCSPSVFFLTQPTSKYTSLEKPLEKIQLSHTPHAKNTRARPPLQTPFMFADSPCLPTAAPLAGSLLLLNSALLFLSQPCDVTPFLLFAAVTPFFLPPPPSVAPLS